MATVKFPVSDQPKCQAQVVDLSALMSRIERKYCLLSTSYMAGLFDIFILLHIVCFGDCLPISTLCDAHHKEFEFH